MRLQVRLFYHRPCSSCTLSSCSPQERSRRVGGERGVTCSKGHPRRAKRRVGQTLLHHDGVVLGDLVLLPAHTHHGELAFVRSLHRRWNISRVGRRQDFASSVVAPPGSSGATRGQDPGPARMRNWERHARARRDVAQRGQGSPSPHEGAQRRRAPNHAAEGLRVRSQGGAACKRPRTPLHASHRSTRHGECFGGTRNGEERSPCCLLLAAGF